MIEYFIMVMLSALVHDEGRTVLYKAVRRWGMEYSDENCSFSHPNIVHILRSLPRSLYGGWEF